MRTAKGRQKRARLDIEHDLGPLATAVLGILLPPVPLACVDKTGHARKKQGHDWTRSRDQQAKQSYG